MMGRIRQQAPQRRPPRPHARENRHLAYLDRAMQALRDLGLVPDGPSSHEAPIVALLQQISDLDEGRVVAITRTLAQASLFNEVVRQQVKAMEIGSATSITTAFNSIRDDARAMVAQIEDGKISTFERLPTSG
jgi:hypothetical protein